MVIIKLNNIITSISVLSNNSSKTKTCRKITAEFSKTMKTIFFNSKTHLTCYTNMRLKTALITFVGKTHEKIQFCISYKNKLWNINRSTLFMRDNMQHLNLETKNKKTYLGATKLKTYEDRTWEEFQSSLKFHNVPKICALSIRLYVLVQENNQVSLKKKLLILLSF